ncbi:MAG: 30S ribosomal protein S9 [Candidatus Kaiserbacteria bacterium GW2011_GWC2_52_8b]|uniref:Small ribosomal subunit protein uS9 n=2 Tax=Candidatus Kaiseribacteriota TaxID=1752734 RepID=A0A0G2ABH7_9BACT|nr:MAG: 30S ribosomal protein S9 [Candidatus Kaiserbacteria bacterium GW2011_GWA2_52_12]KKW29744.1 MAG: 30S ribosomal protein S9 [Candidatus Kaiserbacteria bacterium GW2011_GWC2_52_8b]
MAKESRYTEAVGRRKTATARVRITPSKSTSMVVNGKDAKDYFPLNIMMKTAYEPLQVLGVTYTVTAKVRGGGQKAQAEAVRLGISRAIIEIVPEQRKDLKVRGFLKRDPRSRERKKFGLKGARRAPQWSKR